MTHAGFVTRKDDGFHKTDIRVIEEGGVKRIHLNRVVTSVNPAAAAMPLNLD
jgi:hypothetical protein